MGRRRCRPSTAPSGLHSVQCCSGQCEEPPRTLDSLQLVKAAIDELDPRAHDEVARCARDEYVAHSAKSTQRSFMLVTGPARSADLQVAGHSRDRKSDSDQPDESYRPLNGGRAITAIGPCCLGSRAVASAA